MTRKKKALIAAGFLVILSVIALRLGGSNRAPIGTLAWTESTGGALSWSDRVEYLLNAYPLALDFIAAPFASTPAQVELARFDPPRTPIVQAALAQVRGISEPGFPPFANHSIRLAYWTLLVMSRFHQSLSQEEIDEAWMAAVLHDIGLARPPEQGEFTLGGVKVMRELASTYHWNEASLRRASEAITLNPNSRIDRDKDGLLAWAMNVGGQGETFYGPYRNLMNPENIRQLEGRYPRQGLHEAAMTLLEREFRRVPNQRFALMRSIGFLHLRRKD